MNVLESALIAVATLSALWWMFARHRAPAALEGLSFAALPLAVLILAFEGVHWQLIPWQLVALACAAVALLRRQRLAHSRRFVRVVGRTALVVGILAGGLGLFAARVPELPRPSGPHVQQPKNLLLDVTGVVVEVRPRAGVGDALVGAS